MCFLPLGAELPARVREEDAVSARILWTWAFASWLVDVVLIGASLKLYFLPLEYKQQETRRRQQSAIEEERKRQERQQKSFGKLR